MAAKKSYLTVAPSDKLRFVGDMKGEISVPLTITNSCSNRQAFKVKCTRNDMFSIRPAVGILDYEASTTISLVYKYIGEIPDEEKIYFGVYSIPAPEGCTPIGVWMEHWGPAQGEQRIHVSFKENK